MVDSTAEYIFLCSTERAPCLYNWGERERATPVDLNVHPASRYYTYVVRRAPSVKLVYFILVPRVAPRYAQT